MWQKDLQENPSNSLLIWMVVVGLIIFDVATLAAYSFSWLNWLMLPLIVVGLAYLLWSDLRWLVLMPLLELAWGSFGSEFVWNISGYRITIRMVMFVMVIIIGLTHVHRQRLWKNLLQAARYIPFVALIAVVGWGMLVGVLRGTSLRLVFADSNAYWYVLMFPIWAMVWRRGIEKQIITVILGAALALSLKTIMLFNIFDNQYIVANTGYLYLWLRDLRYGEITPFGTSLWRIFLQSQVYIVIGYSILLARIAFGKPKRWAWYWITTATCMAALIISMSRSYWLAIPIVAVVVLIAGVVYGSLRSLRRAGVYVGMILISIIAGMAVVYLAAVVPYGNAERVTDTLFLRVADSGSDPAGSSRINQLRPLLSAVYAHPLTGSGFGATVTYQSHDPRIRNTTNPSGYVTTYAFEWGYLDQLLKLGLIAFAALAVIMFFVFIRAWGLLHDGVVPAAIAGGLAAGLVGVSTVHVASPYLNHPLGLGYTMLLITMVYYYTRVYAKSNY